MTYGTISTSGIVGIRDLERNFGVGREVDTPNKLIFPRFNGLSRNHKNATVEQEIGCYE